jgi:hypothetical protein
MMNIASINLVHWVFDHRTVAHRIVVPARMLEVGKQVVAPVEGRLVIVPAHMFAEGRLVVVLVRMLEEDRLAVVPAHIPATDVGLHFVA